MGKIKVLHIIPTLSNGGAERLAADLCRFLDKEKFEVKVVAMKSGGERAAELKKAGIEVEISGRERSILFDFFPLLKIAKAFKPDIIHTHLFGADIFGRIIAKIIGVKKVICTEQMNFDEVFYHKFFKKLTNGMVWKIIAVSQAVKDYVIKVEGANPKKIEIIYNATEVNKFLDENRNYELSSQIKIGSLGRLTKQKNFQCLIKALALLPEKDFVCCLAGQGELKVELEKEIEKLNLTEKVKLVGYQNDVPSFLKSLDLFILPSSWEALGIAVLEAGAAGLPVIASAVDGLKEILEDKGTALLFKSNDSEDLAEKINCLLERSDERKRLGQNLLAEVKNKYDIGVIVKKYEALYFLSQK